MLRGSFARYAGQISSADAGWRNPLALSYLEYDWNDANGDGVFQIGRGGPQPRARASRASIPTTRRAAESSQRRSTPTTTPTRTPRSWPASSGSWRPNLAVSAAYTWRKSTDLTATQLLSGYYWYSWIGVTSADYHQGAPVTPNGFTATPYILNDGVADRITAGSCSATGRTSAAATAGWSWRCVKRLSNRWMGRAAFTFNDWKEHVGPGAIINPTHHDLDPQIDGGQHMEFAVGSGKNYYTNAQVAGEPQRHVPASRRASRSRPTCSDARAIRSRSTCSSTRARWTGRSTCWPSTTTDQIRLKNLWDLDVRLAKSLRFGGTNVTLAGEVFNAFNANTELYRNPSATSTSFNRLDEILAPRIARLSARFTF